MIQKDNELTIEEEDIPKKNLLQTNLIKSNPYPFIDVTPLFKVKKVNSPKRVRAFLDLPNLIYKDDSNYVRPLDQDIEAVFDENKNNGKFCRWILEDNNKQVIGRVAAFINPSTGIQSDIPVGGMGFFECVNDENAAKKLFDTCKEWLESLDLDYQGMDGPINFGERDRFWGLLIENKEIDAKGNSPICYLQNYNPLYYKTLFESYGFKTYFKQITYYRDLKAELTDREIRWANMILDKTDEYEFGHIDMSKRSLEEYAKDFASVYNQAWSGSYEDFKELKLDTAINIMKSLKPILDEKIVFFGYDIKNGKKDPIAVFINLPEINPILKDFNGKFGLWEKAQFAWRLKGRKECTRMYGMCFGVVPKYQRRGAVAALLKKAYDILQKPEVGYKDMEFTWIADYNKRMINMCKRIGGEESRIHITYRKLFDEDKVVERYPII